MLGGSDAESSASELKAKRQIKGRKGRGSARGQVTKSAKSSKKSSLDVLGAAFDQALGEDALSGDDDSKAKRKKEKKAARRLEKLDRMTADGSSGSTAAVAEPALASDANAPDGASPNAKLSLREAVAARREKKRKAAAQAQGEGDEAKTTERIQGRDDGPRKVTRIKGELDLGSDESVDAAQIKEWETKIYEAKDKGSDDLKTAFYYALIAPTVAPTSLWTEDGKVDMDAVLTMYFQMSTISPQKEGEESPEVPLELTEDDCAHLLWLIRQAKALQLTTDSELARGKPLVGLGRRKPRKGAPLDLGNEENPAWEEDLSTRRDAMCNDFRTAFSIKIVPLPKHKQSFDTLDGEGKFNLHFLILNIRNLLQAMAKNKKSPQDAQGDDRQLLWIARRARDLNVTNDVEMKRGRVPVKRIEGARKSGTFTLRDGLNAPLSGEKEETEDGAEQARFEFPTLPVAGTVQEDRKDVISNVRSQVAGRQSAIRMTASTTLDMEEMENLLTAPQLSFDAKVKDEDDDEDSGLEVDMPKEAGTSMREMVADTLRRKNSANLAKNLSRSGSSRGLGSKDLSQISAGLEKPESETLKPSVRLDKKQSTQPIPGARKDTGGIASGGCTVKTGNITSEELLKTPFKPGPLVDVAGPPEAVLNNEGKGKPGSSSEKELGSAEASDAGGAAMEAADTTIDRANGECSHDAQEQEPMDAVATPKEVDGDQEMNSVSVSSTCPPGDDSRQADSAKELPVSDPKPVPLEMDCPDFVPTLDLPDISPTAMWSCDDTAKTTLQKPPSEINPTAPIKAGVTDCEISPTMPFVAARVDSEISPTMPFVAAGAGGGPATAGCVDISPTLPVKPAPDAAGLADVEISPTMPFVPAPQQGLLMGAEISPTMPFVAPQGSEIAGAKDSLEISQTQPVVRPVDQNSNPGTTASEIPVKTASSAEVGNIRKRGRSASLLSEDSPDSSDDALSEAEPFGEDPGEEGVTEGMTEADRKRWREEREWLQHRRRAARLNGKAQKRGARVWAKSDQQGKTATERLAIAAGFSHEERARFSATVTDAVGDFSSTADDSAGFFGSLGAQQGRKRISLAAFK